MLQRMFGVLTLIALGLGVANAQVRTAYPEKRGFKLTDFPRTIKLADNVYGYEDIRNPGFTTVSLFVVGTDGVLIVDGQGSPDATRKMLDEIAKVTPKPVKWYIVGSDHGDHTAGNSVLPKDITYVVSKASKEQMKLAAPAMVTDQEVINVGGIEVQALYLGRAHTGGDLLVYLPKQKILFMSEVYLNRVFPAMRSAYPTEWVSVIDKALKMDVDRFVPGSRLHRGAESLARGAGRISEGDARRDRGSHPAAQARTVGGRCGEAGQLGTVQRVVPVGAAGADRRPEDLRRD